MPTRRWGCIVYHSGMDNLPPPAEDPFSLQESRLERRTRRKRRRRSVVIATSVVIVVLAGAAYGTYRLLSSDNVPVGTSTQTTPMTTSLTEPVQSTLAADEGSPPAGTAATSTSTTSVTLANLPHQPLSVTSDPEVVELSITLQDETVISGRTPFSQEIPGGGITVELRREGYNTTVRELALTTAQELRVWLDPEGQLYQTVVRFKSGLGPQRVVFSPDSKELWAAFAQSNGLGIYDPVTGDKTGAVPLGDNGAVDMVFTNDGQTVFAAQMETATVYEIDQASRTVRRRLGTGGTWTKAVFLSPDETILWASNWGSNDVSEIDLTTGELRRRIPTVETPLGLYVTADTKTLYVAGHEHGDIQRIDLSTGKGTVILQTGGAMWHMVADESLGLLYVDDLETNEVYVVDLLTDEVSKLANTDQRPNSMDLSPDGKVLYVSNRGRDNTAGPSLPGPEWGTVLVFDTVTGKTLDAIVGGNQCTGLDVSPDGSLLAFSDFLDNRIRVYAIPAYEELVVGDGGRSAQRSADIAKD